MDDRRGLRKSDDAVGSLAAGSVCRYPDALLTWLGRLACALKWHRMESYGRFTFPGSTAIYERLRCKREDCAYRQVRNTGKKKETR